MLRSWRAIALASLIAGAVFVVAVPATVSWSDGVAGGTAQIPEHLRECAEGFRYCKVNPSLCGGCHGQASDMRHQRESEFPVTDRIGGKLVVAGNPDLWEYNPEQSYFLEVGIKFKNGYDDPARREDARPPGFGEYSDGGFTLNASAGRLTKFPTNDDTVRVTGGIYQHYGSRRPEAAYDCPNDPPGSENCRYGRVEDNETGHAGEAVNTYKGSKQREWTLRWMAPPAQHPHGVAFQLTVMVPNGDAVDSCVHVECNSTLGYSDQSMWDWWTHLIEDTRSPSVPRAVILCEAGYYDSKQDCQEAVLAAVLPPTPPPNTEDPDGENGEENGGVVPAPPLDAALALVAAAGLVAVARRRR